MFTVVSTNMYHFYATQCNLCTRLDHKPLGKSKPKFDQHQSTAAIFLVLKSFINQDKTIKYKLQ